ncbi:MAG: SWIM zinc finger family protein [Clostridia bacterium]|nr:SWIM zinc finger family protein [Clostridia bacterium]
MRDGAGGNRPTTVDLALAFPPRALEAGRDYVALGRVRERARWGEAIAATVEGREPYRVTGRLSAPAEHACTCPARARPCKHGAALFLAFADDPESFLDLGLAALWYAGRPDELAAALADAFLGAEEPGLSSFARVPVRGESGWRALPLAELARLCAERDFPARARLSPEEEKSLYREALARAAREARDGPPDEGAPWLAAVEGAARLAAWGARLGTEELAAPLALLHRLLVSPPPGADRADISLRRSAFDALATLATRLPPRHEGSLFRILRAAFRILPAPEAAARWAARAAGEAEAARLDECEAEGAEAQAAARERRTEAVRALALGWHEAGRPELAAAAWDLHGDLAEADEGRVRAWVGAGDWARARAAAELGLARAPARMVPWFRRQLGRALLELGEPEAAVPLFAANFAESETVRAYRDLRLAARRTGAWEGMRAEAARRLAEAQWPEGGADGEGARGAPPGAAAPAALVAKLARWHSVARALADDAPLLALRYLAAALGALRAEAGRPQATGPDREPAPSRAALVEVEGALLALGERIAREGGPRRVRAWRAALAGDGGPT